MESEPLPMEAAAGLERSASRKWAWLVLAIILAGCVARAWNFHKQDLWTDEFVSYWIVEDGGARSALLRNNHYSTTQPLYFLILDRSVRLFGKNEFALRLPSIAFGCLFLPVVYWLFKELAGRKAAALALFLAALNPVLIYFGREARPYSMCLFLSACSFLAFVRWIRAPESKSLALLWLAATVALVYTHGIFGLALVVQNVIVLVLVLRDEMFRHRLMWRWVLFQILTCAFVAPVLMQLASLMGRREDINYAVDPPDVWQAIVFFPVPALCAGLLAGLTLWCLPRKDRKLEFSIEENRLGLMVLLAMFIIPTLLLAAAGMKQSMLFGQRYRLIAAIGAMGITGIFALGWRNKCMRMAIVAALAALLTAQAAVSLHRSGVFSAQYDHLRGAKKILLKARDLVDDSDVLVVRSQLAEGNIYFDSSDPLWSSYLTCQAGSFYFKNSVRRLCLPMEWTPELLNRRFRPGFDAAIGARNRFWYFCYRVEHRAAFEKWLVSVDAKWKAGRCLENGRYMLIEYVR
jgi:4-amino-4-deoxy-L-arabinose transferase-like glycosyltransferase